MQFDAISNPVVVARIRAQLQAKWQAEQDARGSQVRYEMLALPEVCPSLRTAIPGSTHRLAYLDIHYFVQTGHRHIQQLIPAAEYYNFALNTLGDQRYSLTGSYERMLSVMGTLQEQWASTRTAMPRTGQSSFTASDAVYQLKAEVAASLFFARSLLDVFATFTHFLYQPSARLFSSFSEFLKHIQAPKSLPPVDPVLKAYADANLAWYWALRDYRDFITHYSSLHVAFYEHEGALATYLEHSAAPDVLIANTIAGIDDFLCFADAHFLPSFG
jgi:hypothetical protein